jgi:hypothetical protein
MPIGGGGSAIYQAPPPHAAAAIARLTLPTTVRPAVHIRRCCCYLLYKEQLHASCATLPARWVAWFFGGCAVLVLALTAALSLSARRCAPACTQYACLERCAESGVYVLTLDTSGAVKEPT